MTKASFLKLLLAGVVLVCVSCADIDKEPTQTDNSNARAIRVVGEQLLPNSQDTIEVMEFFTYGCSYCFRIDAYLALWEQEQLPNVIFVRTPLVWNQATYKYARMYLALQEMDRLDTMHREIFRAIHVADRELLSLDDQESFLEDFGISAGDYQAAYFSENVLEGLKTAQRLALRYKVLVVPSLVVNERYFVEPVKGISLPQVVEIVDQLVQREISEHLVEPQTTE